MNNIHSSLAELWLHPHSDIPKFCLFQNWSDDATTKHDTDKYLRQSLDHKANFATDGYAIFYTASNL
jgi:hypothetical protein